MALVGQLAAINGVLLLDNAAYCLLNAACETLAACVDIGSTLGLSRSDAFRLVAATSVIFQAGTAMLWVCSDPLTAPGGVFGAAFDTAIRQIMAANRVVGKYLDPGIAPDLAVAAAFAKTSGQPAAVLPWVAAVSETLLLPFYGPDGAVSAGACVCVCVCVCCRQ